MQSNIGESHLHWLVDLEANISENEGKDEKDSKHQGADTKPTGNHQWKYLQKIITKL